MLAWYIIIGFLIVIFGSMAYGSRSTGAPWVPTWKRDIRRFIALAEPKPGETLYELGCGDARLVVSAAKECDVRGIGVELSFVVALAAWLRARLSRSGVRIRVKNLFRVDLSDADLVYLFLMPEAYEKLRAKFERELKPGARVVTYVWPIPGWEPVKVDCCEKAPELFLYVVK